MSSYFALLILVLLTVAGWAQTSSPLPYPTPSPTPAGSPLQLTLEQAMRTSVDHSPRLEEFRARTREARAKVDEAYVPAYPTATFNAQYQNIQPQVSFPGADGSNFIITPTHNYQLSLVINQAIYTFGRLKWGALTAEMAELSSQESYRNEVEQLFQDVATAYNAAILAEDAVTIADDRVRSQEQQLKDSRNLFEGGVVARFDVVRSEAELSRVRQVQIQAQTEVKLARDRLLTRMGLPVGTPLLLERLELPGPPPTDLEAASRRALELRPEMGVLRWAVESAKARVSFEDSQNSPNLSLNSTATERNVTGFVPGQQVVTGIVFSVPLFDGGLSEAKMEQAVQIVAQLIQQQEATRRNILLEVREAYNTLLNNWEKIAVAVKTVEQSEEALRVANVRYRAGVSTNVELLSAQTDYSQARFSLATARYEYQAAWARWRRVISGDYPVSVPGPIDRTPVAPPAPLYPLEPSK